ncbi:unnamed protein product [Lactuca virosa]|uniref:Uncharacterized protein n=1 Tax=Lactuca virosa TaxID=75947 RepID=A0AAU9N0B2_9ASTR|nr:unnamed protein product [Lactuca virosa]
MMMSIQRDETGGEEQQLLNFKRDFGDEEAYAAVIEHSYGVILTEKSDGGEVNSSPVRGLIVTEVNVEKEVNYSTHVDTNFLTMTQFHRLPGVNEEMVKLLDETELQVYRRKQLMSGISGEKVVGRNIGEAVDKAAEDDDNDKREKRCVDALFNFWDDDVVVVKAILVEWELV